MKRTLTIVLLGISTLGFSQAKSITVGGGSGGGGGITSETDPIYSADSANLKTVSLKKNNSDSVTLTGYRSVGMANKVRDSLANIIGKKVDTGSAIKFTLTDPYDGDLFKYDSINNQIVNVHIVKASAVLDFPSTTSGAVSDLTVAVTCSVGDVVLLSLPATLTTTANYSAWVSSANTVTVRFSPKATEDPASSTFIIKILPQ